MDRDVYTFASGPAIIFKEVLEKAKSELLDWQGLGIGVMEMSHRSPEFQAINQKANDDLRKLMEVPDNYKILFMQGGSTLQAAAVPMNLLQDRTTANYLVFGKNSRLGYLEAQKYCIPNLVTPLEESYYEIKDNWNIDKDGAYFMYTDCEKAEGLELNQTPNVGDQIIVSDMTSTLTSKYVDISKFGCIYASVQHNFGPAGLCTIIVRDDLIGKQRAYTPSMFSWKTTLDHHSIFNTTPCFAVYITGLCVDFMIQNGGIHVFEEIAIKRAKLIYDVIDSSHGFYIPRIKRKDQRSRTNIVFSCQSIYINYAAQKLDDLFQEQAKNEGLIELAGQYGGLKASMYNGMPMEGAQKLKDFMQTFQQKYQE